MTALIVCADDFGMNPAVDEGIAELVALGRVTATSCLVHSPHWPAAARRLPPRERCAVGLHLDFTQFAAPHWPINSAIVRSLTRRLDARALRASVDEQFTRFEEATGSHPDYVDGHQHVHQLPMIRDALVAALAARYANGPRPWIRISAVRPRDGLKSRLVTALGSAALRQLARSRGFATTDTLIGMYDFTGDETTYLEHMRRWLAAVGGATALMCHPASRLEPGEVIAHARVAEYDALRSDTFAGLLTERDIALVSAPA